jgi:hypothetical protein
MTFRYADHRIPLHQTSVAPAQWPRELVKRRGWEAGFLDWYSANRDRFTIKLEFLRSNRQHIEVAFHGITRVTRAIIKQDNIDVTVDWLGHFWDIIANFETYPQRVPRGWVCGECPPDSRFIYATRQDLCQAEVLVPFMEWINTSLAKATALSVSGAADSATWARLVIG